VSDEVPDCMRCGACCFSESDRHAQVTGDDHERLGDEAESLVVFLGNRAYMRVEREGGVGRCAALVVENGRFSCSVYERRPAVCRDLGRGSPACEAERILKGDRPPRLVLALTRRP
jgi:Fe-S-cluster containining protein